MTTKPTWIHEQDTIEVAKQSLLRSIDPIAIWSKYNNIIYYNDVCIGMNNVSYIDCSIYDNPFIRNKLFEVKHYVEEILHEPFILPTLKLLSYY